MRSPMLKSLAAALVVAAVLVPGATATTAASAKHRPVKLRLALVPLQTAKLGPAGASLALAYGSGPTDEYSSGGLIVIGSSSNGFSFGNSRGYALDYGDPFTGSTGVMEIRSSVEVYRSPGEARFALFFGRVFDSEQLGSSSSPVVTVTVKKVKVPRVGAQRFGSLTTLSAANLNPIVRLDEQVAAGRFVLDLTVTAGSASAAQHVAPRLLHLLVNRLRLMLEGHSLGTPAKLPPEPHVGQAPGGPDLSTLILEPTDVGQDHAINRLQAYIPEPPALSAYVMLLAPAGPYDELVQQIGWWPTATEATYAETYQGTLGIFGGLQGGTASPVDVSAVGDGATGYLIASDEGWEVLVTLTNGQAGESIFGISKSPLQASDVQTLAQAAADRLDAGLGP